jgi:glyoxylase-like metal-dependent hydrolase (beta-lactamase superfamily II)
VADSWFSVRANFYHVRGSEADLIVDTGTGIAPLAWMLGGLTEVGKRVIAVATHTHPDHVGGMHNSRRDLFMIGQVGLTVATAISSPSPPG